MRLETVLQPVFHPRFKGCILLHFTGQRPDNFREIRQQKIAVGAAVQ